MKKMIKSQRGVTFLGWCIILAIIAFFVMITLRLFPLYNEKVGVLTAMRSVAQRPGITSDSDADVLKQFLRTVQVGGSQRFDDKSIKELAFIDKPQEKGGARTLTVQFEARNKFFQDIDFVLNFDETVELTGQKSAGD